MVKTVEGERKAVENEMGLVEARSVLCLTAKSSATVTSWKTAVRFRLNVVAGVRTVRRRRRQEEKQNSQSQDIGRRPTRWTGAEEAII